MILKGDVQMKEIVKTAIVFILLILAAILVFTTRGTGNLDFNVKFDSSSTKETFSYDLVESNENGIYRNTKGNNEYIMFGKTADGTCKAYFIYVGAAVFGSDNRYVELRLDNVQFDSTNSYKFNNKNGISLKLRNVDSGKELVVESNLSLGDSKLEGSYIKSKDITHFSIDDFKM